MEQARLFIAIGISFLVFFLWSMFFAPKPPQVSDQASQQGSEQVAPTTTQQPQATPQSSTTGTQAPVTIPPAAVTPAPSQTARTITVDTPLYRMTLSEQGGAVTGLVLKDYREENEPTSPLKELIHSDTPGGTLVVSIPGQGVDLEKATFASDAEATQMNVEGDPKSVRFTHQTQSGLIVE